MIKLMLLAGQQAHPGHPRPQGLDRLQATDHPDQGNRFSKLTQSGLVLLGLILPQHVAGQCHLAGHREPDQGGLIMDQPTPSWTIRRWVAHPVAGWTTRPHGMVW